MEAKEREVAQILAGKGISWNTLSVAKKELAMKVFTLALEKVNILEDLRDKMEQYRFTRNTLADELNISRKTIGSNNPEISALVDFFIQKQKRLIYRAPSSLLHKDSDEITELKNKIEKLLIRDCELIELDNKYRELVKELKAVERQRDAYLKEKLSIKKEMEELEKKYKKTIAELQDQLNPFKINTNNNNFS